jgi:glucosamine 6-phosphate synthetase-like amidotransferase/phosphosugar isomerase protein
VRKALNGDLAEYFEEKLMCGIFGFVLKKPLSMSTVFEILRRLEASQYPDEDQPVGGYGAGLAVMLSDGNIIADKVGKNSDSPATALANVMKDRLSESQVLIGHVRFPSSEFMGNVSHKEAAQPFVENFEGGITVVGAHNGMVENYKELKSKVKGHVFESQGVGLVDSEVVPHYFGELLNEFETTGEAVYELFGSLKGNNVVALLQVDEENAFVHLVHKGTSRGFTVWTNEKDEVIFSSRPEPVEEELSDLLSEGKFERKVVINRMEDVGLVLSFPALFQ